MSLQKRATGSASSQPDLCVFCNKALLRGRLLSCLHNICVSCVREELGGSNDISCPRCVTVTKAPASGVALHLSLPNSYNLKRQAEALSSETSTIACKALCDECMDEEEAEKICINCGLMCCGLHANAHKKTKATSSHTIQNIDEESSVTDGSVLERSACPLHGSHRLELFCEECGELFCERCEQHGAHKGHKDSIIAASQAARKLRAEIQTLRSPELASSSDKPADERNQLQSSLDAVKSSLSSLNCRTEAVSAEINSAFSRVIDAAKEQQQSLINSLDENRWTKQKLLETQQQELEHFLEASEQTDILLERCQSDLDFLRMAPWLKRVHSAVATCMEKNVEPAVTSHMVFEKTNLPEMEILATKAGKIRDIAVDVDKSSITCKSRLTTGQDMDITVEATDANGVPICASTTNQMDFSITVKAEEGEAVPCEVTAGSSSNEIKACLKDPTPGTYQLSVTMGHRHLKGSPMKIEVSDAAMQFDPDQHGMNITLSNDNCTAQLTAGGYYGSVFSSATASCGSLEFSVRFDILQASYTQTHLLVSMKDPPPAKDSNIDQTDAYGWNLQSQGSGYGGGLSPAVQQGDVIAVALDCDRSTVTFTLQRTGQMQILRNLCAGNYYLYISMYNSGHGYSPQVTLM